MRSGKFDEELSRMNAIVDALTPNALILFNESFAATNEREGSEIARQIVSALLERPHKIVFVSHQYAFTHGFYERRLAGRCSCAPTGSRTGGEPSSSSRASLSARALEKTSTARFSGARRWPARTRPSFGDRGEHRIAMSQGTANGASKRGSRAALSQPK